VPQQAEHNEISLLELTNRLRDLGYYDGPFEERPWPATIAALERFQRDHGLPVTSCADTATADALRNSICY
jgi:peptidoglycan hydrolase-like protein with peptidoglycan-binding domain